MTCKTCNKSPCKCGGLSPKYLGGGTETTTTTSSIDPDIKRAVLPALQDVTSKYRSGAFANVADAGGVQSALGQQAELAQGVLDEGLGTENLLRQMRNTQGQLLAGQQGALGSARADRAREAGLADMGMQLRAADLQARQEAAKALTGTATASRGLAQEALDKDLTAAERYFGMLQGIPQGKTEVTTGPKQGGGGK